MRLEDWRDAKVTITAGQDELDAVPLRDVKLVHRREPMVEAVGPAPDAALFFRLRWSSVDEAAIASPGPEAVARTGAVLLIIGAVVVVGAVFVLSHSSFYPGPGD